MKRATKISEEISCRVVPGNVLSREACLDGMVPFMLKKVKRNSYLDLESLNLYRVRPALTLCLSLALPEGYLGMSSLQRTSHVHPSLDDDQSSS